MSLLLARLSGGNAYTLIAQGGEYAVSGAPVSIAKSKRIVASGGAYSLVGQNAVVSRNRRLTAQGGAYSYTGQSVTLLRSRQLVASGGSYALAGQSATLLKSRRIVADGGVYSLVGAAIVMAKSQQISAQSLIRLAEIWARLELDPTRPVTITDSSLTVGTILQTLSETGSTRTGASLPDSTTSADTLISEIWQRLGLDAANPLTQTSTNISFGSITLDLSGATTVVVTRQ